MLRFPDCAQITWHQFVWCKREAFVFIFRFFARFLSWGKSFSSVCEYACNEHARMAVFVARIFVRICSPCFFATPYTYGIIIQLSSILLKRSFTANSNHVIIGLAVIWKTFDRDVCTRKRWNVNFTLWVCVYVCLSVCFVLFADPKVFLDRVVCATLGWFKIFAGMKKKNDGYHYCYTANVLACIQFFSVYASKNWDREQATPVQPQKNTTFTNQRAAAAAKKLYDLLFQFCRNSNPYKKHLELMLWFVCLCSCFGVRDVEENCRIFHFIYLIGLLLDSQWFFRDCCFFFLTSSVSFSLSMLALSHFT